MPTLMYKRLPQGQHIRVLDLVPEAPEGTKGSNPLVLHMRTIDVGALPSALRNQGIEEDVLLAQHPDCFDALSYTWGSPIKGEQYETMYSSAYDVEVDILADHNVYRIKIALNLYEALCEIRRAKYGRPVWVDAICINQSDFTEKSEQIMLMNQIYSKAFQVIVWMGRDVFGDFEQIRWCHETLLDRIGAHIEKSGKPFTPDDFGRYNDAKGVTIFSMHNLLIPDEVLVALYRFYATRRYLARAWIVQEVALSRKCLVLLGSHAIEYYRFTDLLYYIGDLGGMAVHYTHEQGIHNNRGRELLSIGIIADDLSNWDRTRSELELTHGCHDDTSTFLAMLEDLLSDSILRLATEPRDQIYCYLGMVTSVLDIEAPVKPDYVRDIDDVYLDLTKQSLTALPHATILSLVADKVSQAPYVRNLPSWVPDYASVSEQKVTLHEIACFIMKGIPTYSAGIGSGLADVYITNRRLNLSARRIGKVRNTFYIRDEAVHPGFEFMLDTNRQIEVMKACFHLQLSDDAYLFESLLRTIGYGSPLISSENDFRMRYRRWLSTCIYQTSDHHPNSVNASTKSEELANLCRTLRQTLDISFIPTPQQISDESAFQKAKAKWIAKGPTTDKHERSLAYLDMLLALSKVCPEFEYDLELHNRVRNTIKTSNQIQDASNEEISRHEKHAEAFYTFAAGRPDILLPNPSTFFTTSGSMNLVGRISSANVRMGDEVWLICNAKVPFIFRPVDAGSNTDEYRLIGEAYVHGAMHGELIKDGKVEAKRQITLI